MIFLLWLSPNGIVETIQGTYIHGSSRAGLAPAALGSRFVSYYVTNPSSTLYVLILVMGIISTVRLIVLNWFRIQSPIMFLTFVVLSGSVAALISYRIGHFYYPLLVSPLLFLIGLVELNTYERRYARNFAYVLSIGAVLFSSIGFAWYTVQFPMFLRDGVSWGEANDMMNRIEARVNDLCVEYKFWIIADVEDYPHMELVEPYDLPEEKFNPCDAIILEQKYSSRTQPLTLEGYRLIESTFYPERPKILGVPIANSFMHYGYALYIADDVDVSFADESKTPQ